MEPLVVTKCLSNLLPASPGVHKVRKPRSKNKNCLKRELCQNLPKAPSCRHTDKGFYCNQLKSEDVTAFQNKFYSRESKITQDILILRHCAVSAPKRCKSKDGIPRKSHIIHFFIPKLSGLLITVCRKTFIDILGIRNGRVKGVITRYIDTKQIPTENRGGNRQSLKFQKKFQSVYNFLESLQGAINLCLTCGAKKVFLSADQDIRKLWFYYNSKVPDDLRVIESYFRNVFTKHFNFRFGDSTDKERDHCFRCFNKDKNLEEKKELPISESDLLELKMLEMSYPPGEHYLFAPLPNHRNPIDTSCWRNADELENSTDTIGEVTKRDNLNKEPLSHSCRGKKCQDRDLENSVSNNTVHSGLFMQSSHFPSQIIINNHTQYDNNYTKMDFTGQPFSRANINDGTLPSEGIHIGRERCFTVIPQNPEEIFVCNNSCYVEIGHNVYVKHPSGVIIDENIPKNKQHDYCCHMKDQIVTESVKKKPAFKCVPCKLIFSSEGKFSQHKNSHLNKSDLKCEVCMKTFVRNESFKKHLKSHSTKIHKCSMCSMAFNHMINLQLHSEREHPNNV